MDRKRTIFNSKICIPSVPGTLIKRTDLLKEINEKNNKLVIINAGAGYGKTILLAQYANMSEKYSAWYHIDDTDNDETAFLQNLCKSIMTAVGKNSNFYEQFSEFVENADYRNTLSSSYIEMIYDYIGENSLNVILDDIHNINNESIYTLLRSMINYLPDNVTFIVACREDVPKFFSRYIMDNSAFVFNQESLKFNLDETRLLMKEIIRPETLEKTSREVLAQVEGWPVGVMFCFLYLERLRDKGAEMPVLFHGSSIYDYLAFEVYRNLPYELQEFLKKTSVLNPVSDGLCNYIMGIENSNHILLYLEQHNLFTLHIEASGSIYRYHAVFRSFLQSLLTSREKIDIIKNEFAYFMHKKNYELAVECAMECEDAELMQNAFNSIGMQMLDQNMHTTLERWVNFLETSECILTPYSILIMGTFYHRCGKLEKASKYIKRSLDMFLTSMDIEGYVQASIQMAHVLRDETSYVESCRLIDNLLTFFNERNIRTRTPEWFKAIEEKIYNLIFLSRYKEAFSLCEEALINTRENGDNVLEDRFMRVYSVVLFYMGEYARAREYYYENPNSVSQIESCEDLFSVKIYIALAELIIGNYNDGKKLIADEIEYKSTLKNACDLWLAYVTQGIFHMFDSCNLNLDERIREESYILMKKDLEMAEKYSILYRYNISMFKYTQSIKQICSVFLDKRDEKDLNPIDINNLTEFAKGMANAFCSYTAFCGGKYDFAWEQATNCIKSTLTDNIFTAISKGILALICSERGNSNDASRYIAELFPYCAANRITILFTYTGIFLPLLDSAESRGLEKGYISFIRSLLKPTDNFITVRCFGEFNVYIPSQEQPVKWRTKKARELFAYFVDLKGAGVDKYKLMSVFWPELSPEQATDLLHTSLYNIRRVMPDDFKDIVEYRDRKYFINKDRIKSDLMVFDDLCKNYSSSSYDCLDTQKDDMDVYQGEYLDTIEGEWAINPREYYHYMNVKLIRYFAESSIRTRQYDEAIMYLERAVCDDPYEENLHIDLMECYYRSGNIGRVHSQYKKLTQILKTELNTEPSKDTYLKYKQIAGNSK